jgi:predicted RecA/RadA family phage recombinase
MAEALLYQGEGALRDFTPVIALTAGEVLQLADGKAAVSSGAIAAAVKGAVQTEGIHLMAKTATMCLLDGGEAYWDHSANKVHFRKVNDRDFYIGRVVGDAASADTTCYVDLNVTLRYDVDFQRDACISVPTGTQAVGAFGYPKVIGGSHRLELTATSEAQSVDLLTVARFAVASNPIAQFIFRPDVNGTGSTVDFSIGYANGTHTTDADSITEHCLIHIDGGSVNILAQSKDGTTTVTATDTLADITAGTAVANQVEVWMDARDPADVQIYVEGALVLASTVFNLGAAAGPLGLLAHIEKTTGTETGRFSIDTMRCRLMQQ